MNLDEIIDRTGTNSLKYDFKQEHGMPEDILPMWVADMDFRAPAPVLDAVKKAADHGIFGYSEAGSGYFEALHRWFSVHYGWEVRPEWLVKTPGVVYALAASVRAYTAPGDGVLIQQPVYYPFAQVIEDNGRRLCNCPLLYENGRYRMDFAALEAAIVREKVTLTLLCNPHNPVGRVWTDEELLAFGDLCLRHGVRIVSDEIHADFTFEGHRHRPIASLSPALSERTVTCTAPSKTFNLAGLQVSNIWIPGSDMRGAFRREMAASGVELVNTLGLVAAKAAYEQGEPWLREVKAYIAANRDLFRNHLAAHLPHARLVEPEGTYLLWVDFRAYGLSHDELTCRIVDKARLWLDDGSIFGPAGEGFQRFNIACPRATLTDALGRLAGAFHELEDSVRTA